MMISMTQMRTIAVNTAIRISSHNGRFFPVFDRTEAKSLDDADSCDDGP
jgi:hypothetical protein